MSHTWKTVFALLLTLCMLVTASLLASVVWAEPAEDPTAGSSSSTSSDTSNTTSSTTSSSGTSSSSNTRSISVVESTGHAKVFFGSSASASTSYTAAVGETVSFRVVADAGYQVDSVKVAGTLKTAGAGGVYSFVVDEDVPEYVIRIAVSETGNTSSGESSSGNTSSSVSGNTSDTSGTSSNVSDPGTSSVPPAETIELRITITGAGSVSANGQTVTNTGDAAKTESIWIQKDVATQVRLSPAYGYRLDRSKVDNNDWNYTLNQRTLTCNELTTLQVVFTPESEKPASYQVIISCETEGGSVSTGTASIKHGSPYTANINAGGSLTVTVYPAEGYEVDSFKVGGNVQNLSGGSYTLQNIASNTTVTVSFKPVTSAIVVKEAADFDWKANGDGLIILELGANPYIGRSVFDKINTLTAADGSFVVLKTDYIRWYLPCGGKVSGVEENYVHLSVARGANGTYYSTIEASIRASDENAVFSYYELSIEPQFPDGTQAEFNLAELATSYVGNSVDLMVKADQSLVVSGTGSILDTGWTTRIAFRNSRYLVVRVQISGQYTIDASADINGRIDPSGNNVVALQGSCAFQITPNAGYIISAVYVDNIPVAGAAGKDSFRYEFTGVTGNHTIRAVFIPADSNYQIISDVATVQGEDTSDEGGKTNAGLIIALVIVFVAIAGAAALFIVKWRQEKF